MRIVRSRYYAAKLMLTSYAKYVWTERGDGKLLGRHVIESAVHILL